MSMSMSLFFFKASRTASFVISLKVILEYSPFFSFKASRTCHAMASPSLSLSAASITSSASFAAARSSAMTFFLFSRFS